VGISPAANATAFYGVTFAGAVASRPHLAEIFEAATDPRNAGVAAGT
jgi:hypothetical protein